MLAAGVLIGYAVRGLTTERRLRQRFMADLEGLKADSEAREQALVKTLQSLAEIENVLRLPRV